MNEPFYGNDNMPNMMTSPNYSDFLNTSNNSNNLPTSGSIYDMNKMNKNSYAQGVLQSNIGKTGYFFVSFPDSVDWRDKIFYGVLADAGDDYILIYNEDNNEYYLVWSIYLNYATFDKRPNTI